MLASIGCAVATGFAGTASYALAAALVVVYGILIWLDSASLTAGTTGAAEPERRGATLAIHSMLGYAGGFVGPLAMGITLDLAGGMTPSAWAAAFCSVALVVAAGLVAFEWLHRTASIEARAATASPSAAP
jgi:MFS family permease